MKEISIKKLVQKVAEKKSFAVKVTPRESRKFQKILFSTTNIRWLSGSNEVQLTDKGLLEVSNGTLGWREGVSPDYQIKPKTKHKKVTVEELVKLDPSIKWVVKVTPETSKVLQEAWFAAGYSWICGFTSVKCLHARYLHKEFGGGAGIECQHCIPKGYTQYKLVKSKKAALPPVSGWAKDTRVRYRDNPASGWLKGYFSHIGKQGGLYCFHHGRDSSGGNTSTPWGQVEQLMKHRGWVVVRREQVRRYQVGAKVFNSKREAEKSAEGDSRKVDIVKIDWEC